MSEDEIVDLIAKMADMSDADQQEYLKNLDISEEDAQDIIGTLQDLLKVEKSTDTDAKEHPEERAFKLAEKTSDKGNKVTGVAEIDEDGDGDTDTTIIKQDDGNDNEEPEEDNSSDEGDDPHDSETAKEDSTNVGRFGELLNRPY